MADASAAAAADDSDIDALWKKLYAVLLRKTLANIEATPAEELSAAIGVRCEGASG
jgi:hypothetical protein